MKTRRFLSIAIAMLLMLTAAASADGVVYNDVGVTPVVQEGDVTLTVAMTQSADVVDYDTNWLTGYLSELLGGKVVPDV